MVIISWHSAFRFQPAKTAYSLLVRTPVRTLFSNYNIFSKSRIKFLFPLSLCSHRLIFSCVIHSRLSEYFQDHRRVSEQFLETQVDIRKPIQAPRRGTLEGISQLVSGFIEASRNFNLKSFTKDNKIVKTISAHSKSTVSNFWTF